MAENSWARHGIFMIIEFLKPEFHIIFEFQKFEFQKYDRLLNIF